MVEQAFRNAPQTQSSGSTRRRSGPHWRSAAAALALVAAAAATHAQTPPATIEVRSGDTFSGIAAQYTGGAALWRKVYRADLTGLRDPSRIMVGMRFEVATDAEGARYLRLMGPAQAGAAVAAPRAALAPPPAKAAAPIKPAAPAPTVAVVADPLRAPAPPAAAREDDALIVGVLPNIAATTLASQYAGLQRYLERGTGRKVQIVVPGNFKAFFDSTMAGEYDLAVAAPHFARVAQLDRSMIPLVTYEPRINALFVAPADSAVTAARDVRERAVAFANPQSLVAMYGQQWLRLQNLEPGKDYEVKGARTDLGVGRMLLSGDAVAAIMSNGEFRSLPPEESARLKIVEVFARVPNFIIVAHPRLRSEQQALLKSQLKAFFADKADGAAFAQATGFTAIVDVDDNVMRELDAYVAPTRKAMGFSK